MEMEILRYDYEELIRPLLEKTLTCVHQSLTDAHLGPKDITKVMLVGGATRTPLVQELLKERMQLEPRFEINPDLIVAMGASIQAGVIAGEKRQSILVDITPHTYSTTALTTRRGQEELLCVPIIPRNTPLPASKSEMVATLYDSQDSDRVEVYQGEDEVPAQDTFIGDFLIEGLSAVPAPNPIIIHFDLDLNGLIKVTATEKATGLAKTVTLDTRGLHALDLDEARRNIASLVTPTAAPPASAQPSPAEEQLATADTQPLLNTAKDLRKRGEALLLKNLSPQDAEEIRQLVQQSAQAVSEGNWKTLKERNDTLSDLLFYLED
jgi:molecular chaperone DnaK